MPWESLIALPACHDCPEQFVPPLLQFLLDSTILKDGLHQGV